MSAVTMAYAKVHDAYVAEEASARSRYLNDTSNEYYESRAIAATTAVAKSLKNYTSIFNAMHKYSTVEDKAVAYAEVHDAYVAAAASARSFDFFSGFNDVVAAADAAVSKSLETYASIFEPVHALNAK